MTGGYPVAQRMIFVSLPVADLQASSAFYKALGFQQNRRFSDAVDAMPYASPPRCTATLRAVLAAHGDSSQERTPRRSNSEADLQKLAQERLRVASSSLVQEVEPKTWTLPLPPRRVTGQCRSASVSGR
jgi:catechol 2,3-dioxygenase-like lactoylglutathione lyase family enzyme